MPNKNIYTQNGYKGREHYLQSLAEEHGIDYEFVLVLATLMGPAEDFDGLVSAVIDYAKEVNS